MATPPPPAPTPAPIAAQKGKLYRALTPVEHDHERIEVNGTLRLEDKHAKPLLDVKAIELVGKAVKEEGAAE
jgi:hypothetical protein